MPGQRPTCMNGGECVVATPGASPTCVCKTGYTGKACEIVDACLNTKCKNGGVCETTIHGPRCRCRQGFYGTLCESATCWVQSVCMNGGTCVPEANDDNVRKRCDCAPGFFGDNCEMREPARVNTHPCASNVVASMCRNGGSCTDNGCECNRGWIGQTCANEDICVTRNPCIEECRRQGVDMFIHCHYARICMFPVGGHLKCEYDYTKTQCRCGYDP